MLIIQNAQRADFSVATTLAWPFKTPYLDNCAERAARVGRSSTEGLYEEVRKGQDRKVRRCCQRNRKRLGESMVRRVRAADFFSARYDRAMHFRAPSIDPGVMAFIWALLLSAYVYFGLLAIGASSAFAVVIALLSFAGIWLFVRLRGEERPGA